MFRAVAKRSVGSVPVVPDARLDVPARLLGHPTRAALITELMGGESLPSGCLAVRVGVAASTASTHLARLAAHQFVEVDQHGRHRLYRLASPEVADAVEVLQALAPEGEVRSLRGHHRSQRLREARSCYDHLAGRLALHLLDRWDRLGWVRRDAAGAVTELTSAGADGLAQLGVAVPANPTRPLVRSCLDWSERRYHLSGALGAAILRGCLDQGYLTRPHDDRSLTMTDLGAAKLDGDVAALRPDRRRNGHDERSVS